MSKRLRIVPDNDEETITLSSAVSLYGLQRYRLLKNSNEYMLATDMDNHYFIIKMGDHYVCKTLRFTTRQSCLKFLMRDGYEITITVEE